MMTPALKTFSGTPARLLLGAVSASALLIAACGEPPAPAGDTAAPEAAPAIDADTGTAADTSEIVAAAPEFLRGWVRTPPSGRDVTAGYVTLRAGAEDDQLVAASSPAAARIELHTMEDDGEVMRMRQVEAIDLPAGERVALAPGGDHLMIFGIDAASLGEAMEVTLEFASGARSTVSLPVQNSQDANRANAERRAARQQANDTQTQPAADETAPSADTEDAEDAGGER